MIQCITHTVAHDTQYRETDAYQSRDPSMVGPNVGIGYPQGSLSSCSAQWEHSRWDRSWGAPCCL